MRISTKNIITISATVAVIYAVYCYLSKKKNMPIASDANVGTKEQYDKIVTEFSKAKPSDVFTGITPSIREMGLRNFYKNVKKQEADEIIAIGKKEFKDYTPEEKTRVLDFFPKILGVTNVSSLIQK
jgi:hypothetical protein